jgi:hypothetical protein
MTTLVRPLVHPARPLPRIAFGERHEPQIDVRSPEGRREHERERASGREASWIGAQTLCSPLRRAPSALVSEHAPLRQIDACVFEPLARQKCRSS